jgi:hypothetical protein
VRSRVAAFVALSAACLVAVVVAGATAVNRASDDREIADRAVADARPKAQEVLSGTRPFAVTLQADRARAATFGRTSIAALSGGAPGSPVLAGPSCQRVAFAAGKGLCLDLLGTSMAVEILDGSLQTVADFDLPGIPSRARVSPDGRWGGVTAFVVGHAYAAPGQFSTATTIIDLRTNKPIADLEKDFTVTDDGKVIDARDRNYWGLTFAGDGDTFYATLATGADTWLVKGSIRNRRARTIHQNVECPSLSPDETRIGYKKAVSRNPTVWRFHVLDLTTGEETPLAETRSVDDQLAWLDDNHLLYGVDGATWELNADGTGQPREWLSGSDSATITTPASS